MHHMRIQTPTRQTKSVAEKDKSHGLTHHTATQCHNKNRGEVPSNNRHMLPTNTQTPQTTEQKHNKTQLQLHAQHEANNSESQQSNTGPKQHTYYYNTKNCNYIYGPSKTATPTTPSDGR